VLTGWYVTPLILQPMHALPSPKGPLLATINPTAINDKLRKMSTLLCTESRGSHLQGLEQTADKRLFAATSTLKCTLSSLVPVVTICMSEIVSGHRL